MSLLVKTQKIFENKIDIAVSRVAVLYFEQSLSAFSSNLESNSILDEDLRFFLDKTA